MKLESKICSNKEYLNMKNNFLQQKENVVITFVNPYSYYSLKQSNYLEDIDMIFSDGGLLVKCHNLFHENKIDRLSFDFSSIADDFFQFCSKNNLTVSIIASTNNELNITVSKLKAWYPNLKFGFCHDGYVFNEEMVISDFDKLISELSRSDVIISGMGAPKQEVFITKLSKHLSEKIYITCGGFITQTSIRDDYYFPIIKKMNLRWVQRILFHKHVRNKVIREYPKFIFCYFLDNIKATFKSTR